MAYVYHIINPTTRMPFYVGKGSGDRAQQHLNGSILGQNPLKDQYISDLRNNGLEPEIVILANDLSEREALVLEAREILKYLCVGLDDGGILTNRSLGGFGGDTSSYFTDDSKKRMSEKKSGIRNHNTTLKSNDEIYDIFLSEEPIADIAGKYEISLDVVRAIKRKKYFKSVTAHLDSPGNCVTDRRLLTDALITEIYLFSGSVSEFRSRFNISVNVAQNIKNRITYSNVTKDLGDPGEIRKYRLTWDEIVDIRESDESSRALAESYGVCHQTIENIRQRKTRRLK